MKRKNSISGIQPEAVIALINVSSNGDIKQIVILMELSPLFRLHGEVFS